MPSRKKKTQQKMDLTAFLGEKVIKASQTLPSGPQKDRPEEDRYGDSRNSRYPPSRSEESDAWRRAPGSRPTFNNNNNSSEWRTGGGDVRAADNGGRFGNSRLHTRLGGESAFGALSNDAPRDTRPAHLRRFGKGADKSGISGAPSVPKGFGGRGSGGDTHKHRSTRKVEPASERDVELAEEFKKVAVLDISERTTRLEDVILDRKELANVEDLNSSLSRVDVSTLDPESLIVVLQKSIQAKTIELGAMLTSFKRHLGGKKQASDLAIAVFGALLTANDELYVRKLVEDVEFLSILSGGLTGDELATFLRENGLYFLKPVDDLTNDVEAALAANKTAQEILDMISSKIDDSLPVDYLASTVSEGALARVFNDKKQIDLKVLEEFAPLVARCVKGNVEAETLIVFATQVAWFTAGADKTTIRSIFEALHSHGIVSYEGLEGWRSNTTNKAKGKLQALLKVNTFIDEITPPPPREEDSEEEYDEDGELIEEEEDEYLTNPNTQHFR